MRNICSYIRTELSSHTDEAHRESTKRFFREGVKSLGVPTAIVNTLAKKYYQLIKNENKAFIYQQCESLWQSGIMEEAITACNWSYAARKKFEPDDYDVFIRWLKNYVTNWATCDTFCNHTFGTFIEMYPEYCLKLKEETNSPNRWVRRGTAVTFIVPARKGKFLKTIFEISDRLLTDNDDMVQKGCGWVLKEACKQNQEEVFSYIIIRKAKMPRTILRYAIEKMPQELKLEAMKRG